MSLADEIRLEAENAQLRNALDATNVRIERLADLNDRTITEIAQLREENEQLHKELARLQRAIEEFGNMIEQVP
jgi:uncharacterized coiled-coil DUF342 family protein